MSLEALKEATMMNVLLYDVTPCSLEDYTASHPRKYYVGLRPLSEFIKISAFHFCL